MPLKFAKPTPLPVERRNKKNAREAEWQRIRKLVKKRDGNKCRIAAVFGRHEGRIEVHHCKPRSAGRIDSTENCLCACAFHHSLFKAGTLAVGFLSAQGADGYVWFYNPREED